MAGLKKITLLNVCRCEIRMGKRHSDLHRRLQIGLALHRKKQYWKNPRAHKLSEKYGVPICWD